MNKLKMVFMSEWLFFFTFLTKPNLNPHISPALVNLRLTELPDISEEHHPGIPSGGDLLI